MPLRSLPGFLATVLTVSAVVALGLGVVRLDAYELGNHAAMLRGPTVAIAAVGLGALVWAGLVAAEAVVGSRGARVIAALAVLAGPWGTYAAETSYWDRRAYVSAWESGRLGEWRGVLGSGCGYVTVVRLRLDASGNGVGTAVPTSAFSPLYTSVVALSPLDGPEAIPVRAELRRGQIEVYVVADSEWYAEGDTLGTAPVVVP